MRPLRLLQITDCHLGSKPGEKFLGLDTDQSLYDVLNLLKTQESPDMIIATGDISNDAGFPSYERFVKILRRFFPSLPLAWLPGNHDDPANMEKVKEKLITSRYQLGGWNLILLNSRIPNEEGGDLTDAELQRLDQELKRSAKLPTVVFLHHQPVPIGSAWVDQYVVKSAEKFFAITDKYDHIKSICWGHVHQEFTLMRNGVALYATPSTSIQFEPNRKKFKVDAAMPGYRLFELYPDGTFQSQVKRIEEKAYSIDFASTGY